MRFRLFRMGIEGKVAVVNLGLFGLVLTAYLIAFPGGQIDVDSTPKNMLRLASILWVAIIVLSFPVGWLSILLMFVTTDILLASFTVFIFVPLNAYLWGYVVAAVIRRWRKSYKACHGTVDGHSARS